MAIAVVSSVAQSGSGASGAIDTTGATLLVLIGTGAGLQTPTDSKSNTWVTSLTSIAGPYSSEGRINYVVNPTVGSGHTFTYASTAPSLCVIAFSGITTSSPFDNQSAGGTNTANTVQPGSLTPNADDELVIVASISYGNDATTIDGGFTMQAEASPYPADLFSCSLAYLIQTSATSVNPTVTLTLGVFPAAISASFKPDAGAPAGQPTMRRWGGVPFMGGMGIGSKGPGRMWGKRRSGIYVPRRFQEAA